MNLRPRWPWVAEQRWDDVLFIHWPIPYEILRPHVPEQFELETYNGNAWISVVPFQGNKNRFRGMPGPIPFVSSFLELNVRTYIKYNGEQGVYFFSFDADSNAAVAGARAVFSLPYMKANMSIKRSKHAVLFQSKRIHEGEAPAQFYASYRPISQKSTAKEGSLTHWLSERYCLFTFKGNKVLKGSIIHSPWELQEAELDLDMSDVVPFLPEEYLTNKPLVHYSKSKKVHFFPFETVGEIK
ncbi:YqjF family protein [Sediminibacillus albus]|uniref:DUF2071 domain-containing protein n=1 Tax=Sediminibacillus albus TaxID=407036 RepID=A0A1G9AQ40_9BACI|nr:DUF2071 domain-containing protein [Sediminibacillus albus]SDK28700.1 hypothetical protein SAMN05216243_2622 [Sediminibacillus albus]